MIEKNHLKIHTPTIILALAIFIFSTIPDLNVPDLKFSLQDKLAHFITFLLFGFFLHMSFFFQYPQKKNLYLIVFIAGTIYGSFNEIIQLFVEGREADLADWAADSLGVALSQLFFRIYERFKKFS